MERHWSWVVLLLTFVLCVSISPVRSAISDDVRIAVVRNYLSSDPQFFAFASSAVVNPALGNATMLMSASPDGTVWTSWSAVDSSSSVQFSSNPVAVSSFVSSINNSVALVFFQDTQGQVYTYSQTPSNPKEFTLVPLSKDLPANLDKKDFSRDPVQAIYHKNRTHIFVRSQTNTSQLFYNTLDEKLNLENEKWALIGSSDDYLKFDAHAAVNTFLDRIEVFGVFWDDLVHHTWQTGPTSFEGKWEKLGLFSPSFNSSPVAHQMGHSDFNGVLNLFVRGKDGVMYHISQTTCDKVNNPWGPCTWGLFKKLGSTVPASPTAHNPLTASHSIHLGIEIFVIGQSDGELYHIWQRERDASWSDWDKIGGLPNSPFQSQPAMMFDGNGWWEAYGLNSSSGVAHFVQKMLLFSLSTDKVVYDHNVTVTWAIPDDEATHKDWIGVYPDGAPSHGYVDFAYVGGTQNPLKDPVPRGSLNFTTILPNGVYHYKYMVNKEYLAVLDASLSVTGTPSEPEWVQLYTGIARGLGNLNVNITECVEDGNITVVTFKAAFDAFEDRKIYNGLHKFAEGLSDFRDALVQCDETLIVKDLTEFIKDLIACTEGNCINFAIDIGVELVILYEHEYEIYGDIQAASNCLKIDAYEQGGLCIGRVTYACLTLE